MSYFEENYSNIKLTKARKNIDGMRKAQLGSIHAIASYFTKENTKQALIVLPTGTGKTAILMLSPYILESKKVLIITPSKLVRNQIAEDFSRLKTLKNINVLPEICMLPKVFELKDTKIEKHLSSILESDVIVTTPLGAWNMSKNSNCSEIIDLVLVDEAHHEPAKKWREALDNFKLAKKILFTATPFRLDNKKLNADLIYTYTISQAYKDNIFGEIIFIPVTSKQEKNKDLQIALKTEKIFMEDKIKGFAHSIMVRAGNIEEANKLHDLYIRNTNLNLEKAHSKMSSKTIQKIIKKLKTNQIDGIVCVDMMAEGFDFPNLKIAAIHSPHKSLAITLQFIGRFARTNADNIDVAKFIALNNEEYMLENQKLFASDAVWRKMIISLNKKKIFEEEENQRFIEKFKLKKEIKNDLSNELMNMRPSFHAKIFHTVLFDINKKIPEFGFKLESQFINEEDQILIAVLKESIVPRWASKQSGIYDEKFYLIIIYYISSLKLLFINSQIKNESLYLEIARVFCGEDEFKKVSRNELHKVLGGMKNFEIFNTGLQNRASNEESYVINAGPDVSNTFDPATGKLYSAGHIFCKASENDIDITLGYSSGSKIWSSKSGTIKEFIDWCNISAKKIKNSNLTVKTNTAFDFIPIPERLVSFPSTIFLARFSHHTYLNPKSLVTKNKNINQTILDLDLIVVDIKENKVILKCVWGNYEYLYSIDKTGFVLPLFKQDELLIQSGKNQLKLSNYLIDNPIELLTTDLCSIIDGEIAKNTVEVEKNISSIIHTINWAEFYTDVRTEFGQSKKEGYQSIQESLKQILINLNYDYLIFDHGTGEIADYIGIQITSTEICIDLYHAKAMKAKNYNNSVEDLYDVLGQSIKSMIWLKSKEVLKRKVMSRNQSGYCSFLIGDLDNFKLDLFANKIIIAKIIAVQPSIKKDNTMTDKISELLASTNHYIKHSGSSYKFEVWGN